MNISSINKNDCFGCLACNSICKKKAITPKMDREGFVYPEVAEDVCIDCGECMKVCPVVNPCERFIPRLSYGAFGADKRMMSDSSSGGIFFLLAKHYTSHSGRVCGAALDEKFSVNHRVVESDKDISSIRGSKYVQSNTEHVYLQIERELINNTPVLFSGTPCQVHALKQYCLVRKVNVENLLCIDIVCHGVPSNIGLKKWLYKKYGIKVNEGFSFRTHDKYENNIYGYRITSRNDSIIVRAESDPFYNAFLKEKSYRESCYKCPYATSSRVGDITLGDCANVASYYYDNPNNADRAVSMVFINNEKAEEIWKKIEGDIVCFCNDFFSECQKNEFLHRSARRPEMRDCFYSDLDYMDISSFEKKYCENPKIKKRIKQIFKRIVKSNTRWKIRKTIGI